MTERPDLRCIADPEVFAACQRERRALVTESIADFIPIADGAGQRGETHFGSSSSTPPSTPAAGDAPSDGW